MILNAATSTRRGKGRAWQSEAGNAETQDTDSVATACESCLVEIGEKSDWNEESKENAICNVSLSGICTYPLDSSKFLYESHSTVEEHSSHGRSINFEPIGESDKSDLR